MSTIIHLTRKEELNPDAMHDVHEVTRPSQLYLCRVRNTLMVSGQALAQSTSADMYHMVHALSTW